LAPTAELELLARFGFEAAADVGVVVEVRLDKGLEVAAAAADAVVDLEDADDFPPPPLLLLLSDFCFCW